jgi:hypothetical protein
MPRSISPRVSPRAAKKNEKSGWSPSLVACGEQSTVFKSQSARFRRARSRPAGGRRVWSCAAIRGSRSAARLRVYRCLQIRRDAGRAEGVIANARFDAGRFRAPEDDGGSALLEEGIGCKLTGLAAGTAEELERPPGIVNPCGLIEKGPRCRL